jgi:hypothetical protein
MLDTRPVAVKPINAFYTLHYTLPFLTVKFSVLAFQMGLQVPVETLRAHGTAGALLNTV